MKKINFLYTFISIICILNILFLSIPVYANQYREATSLEEFDSSKYPGIKEKVNELKQQHPNWSFTFFYTGLDWSTVVYNESTEHHGRSLVQNKTGEWLCPICGDRVYDGSNWYCASTKAVRYYLDPRNFLNENDIFQFETLSYVEGAYTEAGVEAILNGTFMANKSIREYYNNDNYTESKFSTVILDAGREANVSPYHIASRIKQEIIVSGGGPSNSVTGAVAGYEGLYNFYNIGASGGAGAVERGLKYAQGKEWNSPEIAIKNGASIIANNYIAKGQNTLYLQKFDVDDSNNSIYSHQYMQNIQAPTSEGKRVKNTYSNLGMLDNSHNFIIPLYENMPSDISEIPSNTGTSTFPMEEGSETVKVIANGSLILRSSPTTDSSMLTSLPTNTLVTRLATNVATANGYTWDKIKTAGGTVGYVASKYLEAVGNSSNNGNIILNENKINLDEENKVISCTPQITLQNLKDNYADKIVAVTNVDGTDLTDNTASLGTGMKVTINNNTYYISKYGDINGDGKVKASDYVLIKKHIMDEENNKFDKAKTISADINQDGKIKASDYVLIKNYIMSE